MASPRRLNPLANKRVEMLKHYEVEAPKRSAPDNSKSHCNNLTESTPLEHELTAAINKRIELLKHETTPHSTPKMVHRSPRKTHLTNFMNQNAPTEMPIRKAPNSPVLQLNGRQLKSPNGSPSQRRRRLRSQSPQPINDSDSEMENLNSALNGMGSSRKRGSRDEKLQNIGEKSVPYIQRNDFSCPQSEPLKRKVYKGSSTFEKIKQNFDLESGKYNFLY